MNIYLSVCHDERNKLIKETQNSVGYSGTLKDETSVIEPVVMIEAENLSQYNYMYIPEFGRYYYITDITSVKNNLWRVTGKVDALNTYATEIMDMPIILKATTEYANEQYLPSDIWKTLVKTTTDIINFPSGLNNNGEYILITSGGIAGGE